MNSTASGRGRRRWGGLPRAGVLAATVAAIAVLMAGCGGGGGSPSAGSGLSKTGQKMLAFTRCMRSHGEPNFPDPTSNGTISLSQVDINAPQYHLARHACMGLLPPTGFAPMQLSAAQQQALMKEALKTAACMRSQGVPDFPDPLAASPAQGRGVIWEIPSESSPNFQSASRACHLFEVGGGS